MLPEGLCDKDFRQHWNSGQVQMSCHFEFSKHRSRQMNARIRSAVGQY